MNWTPLNITVRVGCNLAYETTVQTPVLFVLRPRLEGKVLVMQEKLSFGIGRPSYEFQDSHGNITYPRATLPDICRTSAFKIPARRWIFMLTAKCISEMSG